MAIGDVIVGIDIGASKISLVVGEVNNFNQIEVICNTSKKSNGIQKSKIVDENALGESISETITEAEKELDMKINSAYITIPGKYITIVQNSITKETRDKYSGISSRDVSNAIMQAKDIEIPDGKQLIDVITNNFILDNGKIIKDPVGSLSTSFTLNAQIILADKEYLKTISNIFKKVDIDVDGIIPITLAEREVAFDEIEKKDYVMLLDVGAENTDIGVFDGNKFIYTNSIPIGGQNITNDIAIVLNISVEEAEKLKRLNTSKDGEKIIRSSNVVEIIEARVEQLFELVNRDISNQGIKQKINNVVLTGQGISSISKSDIVGKITLNIPVKMANNKIANIVSPTYNTSYALVKYIAARPFAKTVSSSVDANSDENIFKRFMEKVRDFFYS